MNRLPFFVSLSLAEIAWLACFALLVSHESLTKELAWTKEKGRGFNGIPLSTFQSVSNLLWAYTNSLTSPMSPEKLARRLSEAAAAEEELAKLRAIVRRHSPSQPPIPDDQVARRLSEMGISLNRAIADVSLLKEKIRLLSETNQKLLAANELLHPSNQVLVATNQALLGVVERLMGTNRMLADLVQSQSTTNKYKMDGEFSVRRELTGIPTNHLRRVVFVVDTSTSIRHGPAWNSARSLMRTWLEYLPVEQCALVSFSDKSFSYPEKGYFAVRTKDGDPIIQGRDSLLRAFDSTSGGTFTDLKAALHRARQYEGLDLIVLFTDGNPKVPGKSPRDFYQEILRTLPKHPTIPVLAVALGNYEVDEISSATRRVHAPISFLKMLAEQTGGSFIAR